MNHGVWLIITFERHVLRPPLCPALPAHISWVSLHGYHLGELDKMELALLEEGESRTGSPPLPHPQHPKNSGGSGHGQA